MAAMLTTLLLILYGIIIVDIIGLVVINVPTTKNGIEKVIQNKLILYILVEQFPLVTYIVNNFYKPHCISCNLTIMYMYWQLLGLVSYTRKCTCQPKLVKCFFVLFISHLCSGHLGLS